MDVCGFESRRGCHFIMVTEKQIGENLVLLENFCVGDEIHLTNGDIWTCISLDWGSDLSITYMVPLPYESIVKDGFVHNYLKHEPDGMKSLFADAIRGGATIKKRKQND